MPDFAHHTTQNTLGQFFQVIDRRDSYYRQVGTVIDMHPASVFPVRVQFQDNVIRVYHAYQLRRVIVKQTKPNGASV